MDCADCAHAIERSVARLEGVTAASVNYTASRLDVSGSANVDAVTAQVKALGYGIRPKTNTSLQRPALAMGPIGFGLLASRLVSSV